MATIYRTVTTLVEQKVLHALTLDGGVTTYGMATAPHLHVGVRWQGIYLDPAVLLTIPLP